MSVQAISWAIGCDVRQPEAKLLLIVLANYCGPRWECWPSKATLARDCSCAKSSICRRLEYLKQNGLITVTERSNSGLKETSVISLRRDAQPTADPEGGSPTRGTTPSPTAGTGVVPRAGQDPSREPENLPPYPPRGARERGGIPIGFATFWGEYPARDGDNPRKAALAGYRRALRSGADPAEIAAGARRFAEACRVAGKTGTRWVPMASHWLDDRRWEAEDGPQTELTDAERAALIRSYRA